MQALEEAFRDIAAPALGFPSMEVRHRHRSPPNAHVALLGLTGADGSLQIGLAADFQGWQALAMALLGLSADEGPLAPLEAADAFCEIVNIAAGSFKVRLREQLGALQMGLPVYLRGVVEPTEHVAIQVADVTFGEARASLLLVYSHGASEG